MKLDLKSAMAWVMFLGGGGVVLGSYFIGHDVFIAMGTLWLREMAAVRSVIFPTRNEEAVK